MDQAHRRRMPAQRLTESGDPIDGGGATGIAAAAAERPAEQAGRPTAGMQHTSQSADAAQARTTDAAVARTTEGSQSSGESPSARGPWRDAFDAPPRTGVNVGNGERIASGAAGVALMGLALRRPSLLTGLLAVGGAALVQRGASGHCAVYQRLGRDTASASRGASEPTTISASVTIARSADEVYRLWSDPAALKEMLGGLVDVEPAGDGELAWSLPGPLGTHIRWRTRTTVNRPGERMDLVPAGDAFIGGGLSLTLSPAPAGRGTIARLEVRMQPPGGAVGAKALEYASIVPKAIAGRMLARLKSVAETGEVITTVGQPSGREAETDDAGSHAIGRQLGLLSLGLGAAGTLTPAAFASVMGMPQHAGLFFVVGLREMATGIGLLAADKRAPWAWARVAGDAMDLVILRSGLHSTRSHRGRVATAMLVIGAITVADLAAARRLQRKDA
jgi:uncharacterized membrane protein